MAATIATGERPPRLGFAREADRRGGNHAVGRRGGPGDRAGGRLDGLGRSARPARRRRRAWADSTSRARVANVDGEIARALIGRDAADQAGLDAALIALDGYAQQGAPRRQRDRRGVDGGVARGGCSAAGCRSGAISPAAQPVRLPLPEIQILGGGAHAGRRVDIQDFLVVCPSARSFAEALERTAEVYHAAGARLAREGRRMGVADEGAGGRRSTPTRTRCAR